MINTSQQQSDPDNRYSIGVPEGIHPVAQVWLVDRYITIDATIDVEWYLEHHLARNTYICLTWREWRPGCPTIFLEHPDWRKAGNTQHCPSWDDQTAIPTLFGVRECEKPKTKPHLLVLNLHFFWSLADPLALLGDHLMGLCYPEIQQLGKIITLRKQDASFIKLPYYLEHEGKVRQLAINLIDHSGYKTGGLAMACEKSGIILQNKDTMDDWKTCMNIPYNDPALRSDFIIYSCGDTPLQELWEAHVDSTAKIRHTLKLPDATPKRSKGSNVAAMLYDYLDREVPLTAAHIEALGLKVEGKEQPLKTLLRYASVSHICQMDKQFTDAFAAVEMGGMCKNPSPLKAVCKGLILSPDWKSAYATALSKIDMVVGLPTLYSIAAHHPEQALTLEQFLNKYERKLIPDKWHATIDTFGEELSFEQNLFYSKVLDNEHPELEEEDTADFDETGHFKGNFGLFTNTITNGVLTVHSLQTVRAVWTAQEWGEFRKAVKVKAAHMYFKELEADSVKDFQDNLLNNKGGLKSTVLKKGGHKKSDSRSRAWFAVPFAGFMNPLIEARSTEKKKLAKLAPDSKDYIAVDALQNDYKETNNTVIGVIGSTYFPVSNACIANNVTDMLRCAAWAMSVCTVPRTLITDGAECHLNQFRMWTETRPGIDTCTKLNRPHLIDERVAKRVQTIPLGGHKWEYHGQSRQVGEAPDTYTEYCIISGGKEYWGRDDNWPEIDKMYLDHVKTWFAGCKLDWLERLTIACKDVFLGIAIHGQSNYMLETMSGERKYKARGHQLDKDNFTLDGVKLKTATIETTLNQIYDGKPITPQPQHYSMDPVRYKLWNISKEGKGEIGIHGLKPGDSHRKMGHTKLISPSLFYYPSAKVKKVWENRYNKLKDNCGWGLEGDYVAEDGTVDLEAALWDIQYRIDNNTTPLGYNLELPPPNPLWEKRF